MKTWGFCSALAAMLAAGAACGQPQATIESGTLTGVDEGPAQVFRAIPYAAPPVGPLRWAPPAPAGHWTGARAADRAGPACPQPVTPGRPNGGGYSGPTDEDCLTLDVTTPHDAKKAPVMVWVYGGGNSAGASNLPSYDARNFARDGIVVVAMNYRLGPLGFFAHPALTAEAPRDRALANYGLMDQIAALKWVHRNIAAFGGDPDNVTLFGESAGGLNVLQLMAAPSARGLFQRAIVQSGVGGEPMQDLKTAEAQGAELATRAGLPGAQATVEQLRALPVQTLLAAARRAQVVVDGRLIEEPLTVAFARGDEARVPLIIGWNSNEASLLHEFGATPAQWIARTSAKVKAAYGEGEKEDLLARDLFNDEVMGAPARWFATEQEAHRSPAWLYYFSYVPERQRNERLGTNHASEIPFVFDSIDAVPGRTALATTSERAEADLAHACWVAFAREGRPDCASGRWTQFSPANGVVFEFGDDPGPRPHFREAQLNAEAAANPSLSAAP
ncbi:MAG: carboxylesterase family protein [Caulobacteraceae bacterium]|nr:carboxylesterase family protein [Caulobacteraceae bacterium]